MRWDRELEEIRSQPALDLGDGLCLPRRVVLELVGPDPADGEVPRRRMTQIDPADGRGRRHREALGELDPEPARAEELEELPLLAVVRTGRIAERGPDAAEPLGE